MPKIQLYPQSTDKANRLYKFNKNRENCQHQGHSNLILPDSIDLLQHSVFIRFCIYSTPLTSKQGLFSPTPHQARRLDVSLILRLPENILLPKIFLGSFLFIEIWKSDRLRSLLRVILRCYINFKVEIRNRFGLRFFAFSAFYYVSNQLFDGGVEYYGE